MKEFFKMMSQRNTYWLTIVCCFALLISASGAYADDVPAPDGDPVEVSDTPSVAAAVSNNGQVAAGQVIPPPGYQSQMLGGEFRAEWMKLSVNGRQPVFFWGARIVNLDPNSPLRQLGLNVNDVVTRLDQISVANNMVKMQNNPFWTMSELEGHFGHTDVRYIFHKTKVVREQSIDLGPMRRGNPNQPNSNQPTSSALDP